MADNIPSPASGKRVAFEILVRAHHRRLLSYAQALVKSEVAAEDIVQESFIVAYHKLEQFDTSRDFAAWLRGIIRFKYLEWKRSRQEMPLEAELLEGLESFYISLDRIDAEAGTDVLAALRTCLKRMNDVMRTTMEAFYFSQQSCLEIAAQMSTSEEVVKKRLQRGREMLHGCINQRLKGGDGELCEESP